MNVKEAILNRRSIRKFKDTKVEKEKIELLLEAGYSAPSACNRKPFHIYVITNEEKITLLDKSGMFTKMHSPLIILVCGNTKRALPLKLKEYWIQDASAVTENILIMAESLELSTCWNGVHPQEKLVKKIKDILELPEHFIPMSLIHVGYKDEEKKPNSGYDNKFVTFIE